MRKTKKQYRDLWESGAYFEAGFVTGSNHPRNNIYLKFGGIRGRKNEEYDFTVDEAASIAHVLMGAVSHYTSDKRDELAPFEIGVNRWQGQEYHCKETKKIANYHNPVTCGYCIPPKPI